VPGVLGVGVALCDASGYPRLAVSVSSLISRMQAPRQRSIADLIRAQLAQDEIKRQRWTMPGEQA